MGNEGMNAILFGHCPISSHPNIFIPDREMADKTDIINPVLSLVALEAVAKCCYIKCYHNDRINKID